MYDLTIILVVIIVIAARVYLMKGNFILPTFYKEGNKVSFNLGSIGTIIIGLVSAFMLMQSQPELFANWYVAGITAYSAPQIVDSIITKGTRIKNNSDITSEDIESQDDVIEEDVVENDIIDEDIIEEDDGGV